MVAKMPKKNKNPPFFSHEFVIQNHGDIVSCVAMVIVVGLMIQATSAFANMFIIPQHEVENKTDTSPTSEALYTTGLKDLATVFFYTLIVIVIHAIAQDYLLDKINRKLHLSKLKHSKFNESGHIALFALISAAWSINALVKDESLKGPSSLWSGYPEEHALLTFRTKFFFIIQIAYWIHCYPELYFQKVKREEMMPRIVYATLHLILITGAYVINMTRLACVLLFLHYVTETALHLSKLLFYAEYSEYSAKGFKIYNSIFFLTRFVSLILTIVTIQFGLGGSANQVLDVASGNFNTPLIRLVSVVGMCGVQAWMMWCLVTFHLAKRRLQEQQEAVQRQKMLAKKAELSKRAKGRNSDEDVNLLPEVDQNTRRRR